MNNATAFTAYRASDVARVRSVMDRHVGPDRAASIGAIVAGCGMPERKVRAILPDLDGRDLLFGENEAGRFVARTAEEAAAMTARLQSRAVDERARCNRRDAYAAALAVAPVLQLAMAGVVA